MQVLVVCIPLFGEYSGKMFSSGTVLSVFSVFCTVVPELKSNINTESEISEPLPVKHSRSINQNPSEYPISNPPLYPPTSPVIKVPIPRRKGTGLMIAAGATGALGWGVVAGRMAIIGSSCKPDINENTMVSRQEAIELLGAGIGCTKARVKTVLLYLLQGGAGIATWGLSSAAGTFRGQYDAAIYYHEGAPERNPVTWIVSGATLLGAGIIGRATVAGFRIHATVSPLDSYIATCVGDSTTIKKGFECYVRKNQLHFFASQLTSASIAAGGFLLAYGLAYRSARRSIDESRFSLQIVPEIGLNYTGLSANLQF